jgi:hypothetical protein
MRSSTVLAVVVATLCWMFGVFTASALIAGCSNSSESDRGRQPLLQKTERASKAEKSAAQDPCTLLSAREPEPYVGALGLSPFRASDGSNAPDTAGEECVYRGKDGRELTVLAGWTGGDTMSRGLHHRYEGVQSRVRVMTAITNGRLPFLLHVPFTSPARMHP